MDYQDGDIIVDRPRIGLALGPAKPSRNPPPEPGPGDASPDPMYSWDAAYAPRPYGTLKARKPKP